MRNFGVGPGGWDKLEGGIDNFRRKSAGSSGSGLAKAQKLCHIRRPLANTSESVQCRPLEVQVGDKGIERAIKHLKRKMAAEGILRELKRRRHYMKPSIKKRKKMSEAARRRRKRLKTDEIPRTMG
jgi:small subunit ribosomal protein S21